MFKGFKEFISRGNAIDLAVGVVVGAAFTLVIDTLVGDIINPLIGAIFGQPDFSDVWTLHINLPTGDPAAVKFGALITVIFNFLVVAAALYFTVVYPMNKLAERRAKGAEEETAEEMSPEVQLLTEIRDQLAGKTAAGATDDKATPQA